MAKVIREDIACIFFLPAAAGHLLYHTPAGWYRQYRCARGHTHSRCGPAAVPHSLQWCRYGPPAVRKPVMEASQVERLMVLLKTWFHLVRCSKSCSIPLRSPVAVPVASYPVHRHKMQTSPVLQTLRQTPHRIIGTGWKTEFTFTLGKRNGHRVTQCLPDYVLKYFLFAGETPMILHQVVYGINIINVLWRCISHGIFCFILHPVLSFLQRALADQGFHIALEQYFFLAVPLPVSLIAFLFCEQF